MKQVKWLFLLFPIVGMAQNLDEARLEFDRYEYEKSAQLFTSIQANNKLKTEDLKMLAYANYVSGNWEKCLENVSALVDEKQADPMHYLMRADALKALSRYSEAIEAYQLYKEKDPTDNVAIDIQSCSYLPTLSPLHGMRVQRDLANTKKADIRYLDGNLGTIYFHEIGTDSVRNKMTLEAADMAELMLLRPFVTTDVGAKEMILFPEKFDFYSVSSFSKDPMSNRVVFTAYGLLEKHGVFRAPQLYVGNLAADNKTVTDVVLWQHAHPELGESTAFASFVPGQTTIVFSMLKKGSNTFSDFYWSSFTDGGWSNPLEVNGVNTIGEEEYFMFSGDKVYFSSTGRVGYGGLDVYEGTFNASSNDIASVKHLVAPINTASDEFYYFGNADTSYITSNRFGSNAEDDVWELINEDQIAQKQAAIAREKEVADSLARAAMLSWEPPKIYYDFNTDNPNSDYSFLERLATILKENPTVNVEIVGYTDIRGSEEYNDYLSLIRAKFVKKQLIDKGIPEERIQLRGEGKSLAEENSTVKSPETVHQENRFVLITLIKNK